MSPAESCDKLTDSLPHIERNHRVHQMGGKKRSAAGFDVAFGAGESKAARTSFSVGKSVAQASALQVPAAGKGSATDGEPQASALKAAESSATSANSRR